MTIVQITNPETGSVQKVRITAPEQSAPPQEDRTLAGRAFDQAQGVGVGLGQGATLGFMDELQAAIGAGIGAPFLDETFSELYDGILDQARTNQKQVKDDAPTANLIGEIVGSLSSVGGAAKGLGLKAAKTTGGRVAQATGAGVGLGLVEGIGRGEGDETASTAIESSLLGGAGGAALQAGAEFIPGPVGRVVKNISNRVRGVEAEAPTIQAETGLTNIPLTEGQRTQNATQQLLEEDLRKGVKGESAQNIVRDFDTRQQNTIQRNLDGIAGTDVRLLNEEKLIGGVVNRVRQEADTMRNSINDLYAKARESGNSVLVDKTDLTNVFSNSVKSKFDDLGFTAADQPKAFSLIQDIEGLFTGGGVKATGIRTKPQASISELERWRTRVTNAASDAAASGRKSEARALRTMREQYDQFLIDVIDTGLKEGDESAVQQFSQAIRTRAEFGRLFESDKLVERILKDDELTTEQAANFIFGRGKPGAKDDASSIANRLIAASGKDKSARAATKEALKAGAIARIFRRSEDNALIPGTPNLKSVSTTKLEKEIDSLLSNRSLARTIFTRDEIKFLSSMRNDLVRISSRAPGVVNNSNSAVQLQRAIREGGIPLHSIGQSLQAIKFWKDSANKASGNREALAAIGQFYDKLGQQPFARALAPGLAGGQAGQELQE